MPQLMAAADVAVPTERACLASLARQLSAKEWEVQAGPPVEAFIFANGPNEIVAYNLGVVRRRLDKSLVERATAHGNQTQLDLADVYTLTPGGKQRASFQADKVG